MVLVHSSLSACGRIEGGVQAVIAAVQEWNEGGTVSMPAHSYCYPGSDGVPPLFDVRSTPSVVGAITDAFWRRTGAHRSIHPTHSLAAIGPGAAELTDGHEQCDTPCGTGTPYERLIAADAAVLMFGVTLDAYTLFHSAEDAAAVPYLYEPVPVRLRYLDRDRHERSLEMRRHDMGVARRFARQDRWLEARGLLSRRTLGRGELLLIPHARASHEAVVAELCRNPGFLADRESQA